MRKKKEAILVGFESENVKQFSSDKILKHLDRVNAWLEGKNPYPVTVELDMTNICNHRCPECVVNYFRKDDKNYLSKKFAVKILKQLAKAKIRGLIFTGGGEPLCNSGTVEMVKLARSLGMEVGFITNGSLLDEQKAKVILKSCTWIRVSLDAVCPRSYFLTHGVSENEFNKVVSNIAMLANIKKKNKLNCTIGIGYLTCEKTASQMEKASLFCSKLGVDYLQFRPMQVRNGNKFEYFWFDVDENIKKCLPYSRGNYKILFSKHKYEMMHEKNYGRFYKKCYGQQFATVIAADAKVYVCCHLRGYDKYCLGNLHKNTFRQIWNSQKRKQVISNINFNDCIPLCRDNTFNQILWNIKQPREHMNFL